MYRDDLTAAHARLETIQRELATAQSEGQQDKQRIATLYAQLQAAQQALTRMGGQMQQAQGQAYGHNFSLPPRSTTVLVLGILSLALCSVMGPFAWSMGTEELRRIDAGLTSPYGRGSVVAGRICGIVATSLMCVSLVVVVFALLVAR